MPATPLLTAIRPVDIIRVGPASARSEYDVAAAEEPLEIRLDGRTFLITMRTPGADGDLAAGLLLSEGIVRTADEIAGMRHCTRDPNVLYVTLAGAATRRAAAALDERRHVAATSACGVCGRRSIADLMKNATAVRSVLVADGRIIPALPNALRSAQRAFDHTGGIHAAGLFDGDGGLLRAAEDVGRHNAVDKVLGAELLRGALPLAERILFVSGRTSFEIVQKAVMAGVAIVAAVSAPSSLAIDLARTAQVTLLGFVRHTGFNIYAHPERIDLGALAAPPVS